MTIGIVLECAKMSIDRTSVLPGTSQRAWENAAKNGRRSVFLICCSKTSENAEETLPGCHASETIEYDRTRDNTEKLISTLLRPQRLNT